MSYAIYIGKNHSATGHAWLGGYGDEPSSHYLEIVPADSHPKDSLITVGVGPEALMPGVRIDIPQATETFRHIRVSYSFYLGVPAPITNGGLNAHGVAVRDVWSASRTELQEMTPKSQRGLCYSDIARIVLERATSARHAVDLVAGLIAEHGESTYGGNSHIFADAEEAWVMIQFAGGKGLWVAERLGPDSIRASRPGYILDVPVHDTTQSDFLWSPNFVSFAEEMGWYSGGAFNANTVFGDCKGRWDGVSWVEGEMQLRASRREKIDLHDVIWAVRTPRLTGDTAGYGQVVPLVDPGASGLRMLWHTPTGAVAAPFAPVFMGLDDVPPEFAAHRYLTDGESHRFMDNRKALDTKLDSVSKVSQRNESSRFAFYESKRLMYLMQLSGKETLSRVTAAFEAREAKLSDLVDLMTNIATKLPSNDASSVLAYVSKVELGVGLDLVKALADGLEAELRAGIGPPQDAEHQTFKQIW